MTMPAQKPGMSEQSVGTPAVFLDAVRNRMRMPRNFAVDLAADDSNFVTEPYFTRQTDSLSQQWSLYCGSGRGWGWLNPEFAGIYPWAQKCWEESRLGAEVLLLVPAATGASWWVDYVQGKGYVTYLQGRITFVGHAAGYPKDLALIAYAPWLEGGSCTWRWDPPKPRLRAVKGK